MRFDRMPARGPIGEVEIVALISIVLGLAFVLPRLMQSDARPVERASVASTHDGGPLPEGEVRHIAMDASGNTWVRLRAQAATDDRDRVVLVLREGRMRSYPDLRAAVEANYGTVQTGGSLPDFWGVDGLGRVWVGGAYYSGFDWTEVVQDVETTSVEIDYDERVAIDGEGRAWVVYGVSGECPVLADCSGSGIARVDENGSVEMDYVFDTARPLMQLDLPRVRFEYSAEGETIAVGPRSAVVLETDQALDIEAFSVDPRTGRRAAGQVTAITRRPDGGLSLFGTVELEPGQSRVQEMRWVDGRWSVEDLSDGPLFQSTDRAHVTAAVYTQAGDLWLATSTGDIALREGSRWTEHLPADGNPLVGVVRDMVVDDEGRLWLGDQDGVVTYQEGRWSARGDQVVLLPLVLGIAGLGHSTAVPKTPTPPPPPGAICTEPLQNPDFELGAGVGWSLETNLDEPNADLSRYILMSEHVPDSSAGNWLLRFPGIDDSIITVVSNSFELPEQEDISFAELSFRAAMWSTEEEPDGERNDDFIEFGLRSQDGQESGLRFDEETLPSKTWYWMLTNTWIGPNIAKRPGWDRASLFFRASSNSEGSTEYLIDSIRLKYCVGRTSPMASGASRPPRTRAR